MKRFLLLVMILLLVNCSDKKELLPINDLFSNKAYIYDKNTVNVDSCHIIGYIGIIQLNRKCDVSDGYIHIGSKSVFKKSGYNVDLSIYLDTIIHIKEYKLIY